MLGLGVTTEGPVTHLSGAELEGYGVPFSNRKYVVTLTGPQEDRKVEGSHPEERTLSKAEGTELPLYQASGPQAEPGPDPWHRP